MAKQDILNEMEVLERGAFCLTTLRVNDFGKCMSRDITVEAMFRGTSFTNGKSYHLKLRCRVMF